MGPRGTASPTFILTCNKVEVRAGNIYIRPLLQKINANHAEQFEGAYCFPLLPLFLRDKKLTSSFPFEFLFWQLPLFCFVFFK